MTEAVTADITAWICDVPHTLTLVPPEGHQQPFLFGTKLGAFKQHQSFCVQRLFKNQFIVNSADVFIVQSHCHKNVPRAVKMVNTPEGQAEGAHCSYVGGS